MGPQLKYRLHLFSLCHLFTRPEQSWLQQKPPYQVSDCTAGTICFRSVWCEHQPIPFPRPRCRNLGCPAGAEACMRGFLWEMTEWDGNAVWPEGCQVFLAQMRRMNGAGGGEGNNEFFRKAAQPPALGSWAHPFTHGPQLPHSLKWKSQTHQSPKKKLFCLVRGWLQSRVSSVS